MHNIWQVSKTGAQMSNCSFWKNYCILVNLLVGIYSSDHSNLNLGCELSMRFLLKLNLGNPLSANFKKWLNTLKQFVGNLATNCLSVFGHFVGLALRGLILVTPILNSYRKICF